MTMPRLPEPGDVIRRSAGDRVWYGVVKRVAAGGSAIDYIEANGSSSTYLSMRALDETFEANPGWCYANPNRLDHADIPPEIWALSRQIKARALEKEKG
jgi:hypothetical protein